MNGFTTHSRSRLIGVKFGVDVRCENAPPDFRGLDFLGVELTLLRLGLLCTHKSMPEFQKHEIRIKMTFFKKQFILFIQRQNLDCSF